VMQWIFPLLLRSVVIFEPNAVPLQSTTIDYNPVQSSTKWPLLGLYSVGLGAVMRSTATR
jgi:hypothetical protein